MPSRPEHLLDHWEKPRPAAQPFFQEPLQPPREQLHERKHARVQGNVDVVNHFLQVIGDDLRCFERRVGWRLERRGAQQLIKRGGVVALLGEPVALSEGCHFKRTDPLHEPVEMLANPRF
jgi:hypothetical protein